MDPESEVRNHSIEFRMTKYYFVSIIEDYARGVIDASRYNLDSMLRCAIDKGLSAKSQRTTVIFNSKLSFV